MFPMASISVIALHPLFPEAALGVPGQLPFTLYAGLNAVWHHLSQGLSFKIFFSPFLFSLASSIKHFYIFVCQLLCS
jgi:hypothetical protein